MKLGCLWTDLGVTVLDLKCHRIFNWKKVCLSPSPLCVCGGGSVDFPTICQLQMMSNGCVDGGSTEAESESASRLQQTQAPSKQVHHA